MVGKGKMPKSLVKGVGCPVVNGLGDLGESLGEGSVKRLTFVCKPMMDTNGKSRC
jgi:hypothetical protein